jgi:exopolyphosphatase/guanosine-5'-triphosphate,3'-diphosphate pyrophosphatase
MERLSVIDIGTNSIKFCVAQKASDGTLEVLKDANDIARLGEGLRETGLISPEALERNAQSVAAFAREAEELGAAKVMAVGTMALRTAKNTADFTARVKELCGLTVDVLPGDEEARLAYLAVLSGLPVQEGELVIFDTGGGSTEFIFGQGKELKNRMSVNLGAVLITEKHLSDDPVKPGAVQAALAEIKDTFDNAQVNGNPVQLVGMGGTVTSMGAVKHKMVKYDPDVIQGSELTLADVEEQINDYSARTLEKRREIPGLQPKRADVILAGACILKDILSRMNADRLVISDRGLRHGLLFDQLNK